MKRYLLGLLLFSAFATGADAQSGTNSPYSQYGLGVLSDQTSGFNRGMNGLGLALREHNQVNYVNPASYSAMDSLTFIFDVGFTGQLTNFSENGVRKNAKNADFEYAVAGFRAFRHVGVGFGIIPFTNIGYNYSSSANIGSSSTTYTNTYSGEGGIHQVFLGVGWEPLRGLSVGANVSYLWGDYSRSVVNSYSDAYINTLTKSYSANVKSYKLDFGAQYAAKVGKKDVVTVGVTFSPGHSIDGEPQCVVQSANSQTGVTLSDTLPHSGDAKVYLKIPTMYGAGISWNHANVWKLGFDYSVQKWGSVDYPYYQVNGNTPEYVMKSGIYQDRSKFTLGGEYCPQEFGRNFFKRIHYRAGASYATPYYKVNGVDGPKEISVSAGFGIPIINGYNNRSILNISGQWTRTGVSGLIQENTFRINIGLTFNERWFMKWKVE